MSPEDLAAQITEAKHYNLRVIGGFLAAIVVGVLAIPLVWNWSAKQRWEKAKVDWVSEFGVVNFLQLLPASIPDDANFFAVPELKDLALEQKKTARLVESPELQSASETLNSTLPYLPAPEDGHAMTSEDIQEWYAMLVEDKVMRNLAPDSTQPAKDILQAIDRLHPDVAMILQAANARTHAQITPSPGKREWRSSLFRSDFHWATPCLHLSRLFYARGLAALHAGLPDEALKSILVILHIVKSSQDEPFLLSLLVRLPIERYACGLIWQGLAMDAWTEDQANRLLEAIASVGRRSSIAYTMKTEAAALIATPLNEAKTLSQEASAIGVKAKLTFDQAILQSLEGFSAHSNTTQLSLLKLLTCLPDAHDTTAWPTIQTLNVMQADLDANIVRKWLNQSSKTTFGMTSDIAKFTLQQSATRRQIQLGFALASFANERGRMPSELAELLPTFLKKVPTDPIDGKAMRYSKLTDGYQLWSIGFDGKDDGGDEKHDWAWRVLKPHPPLPEKQRKRAIVAPDP